MANEYATLDRLKTALKYNLNDTDDDDALEVALDAASRMIDAYCGRKFFQDATVVNRSFYPADVHRVFVNDISTTTGLVVKADTDDDGTFETTLTINTDFIVEPVNAAAELPVQPYTCIRLIDGTLSGWSVLSSGRPFVQVTAKFGWPAIPDGVERACVMQAKNIAKAPDLYYGSFQLAEEGVPQRVPYMDPMAKALLEQFVRWDPIDGG